MRFATSINQSKPELMSSSDREMLSARLSRSMAVLSQLWTASGVFQDPSGNIRICLKQAMGMLSAEHLKYIPRNAWEFVKRKKEMFPNYVKALHVLSSSVWDAAFCLSQLPKGRLASLATKAPDPSQVCAPSENGAESESFDFSDLNFKHFLSTPPQIPEQT